MKLDRVTITGADNSISPIQLLMLSRKYPFVEWGILASASSVGQSRFPTWDWIAELQCISADERMQLSLHVCGRWVRQWLLGSIELIPIQLAGFDRIQLNFHAERTPCNPDAFGAALREFPDREFIFQIDGSTGNKHLEAAYGEEVDNAVALFDISGGAGILPSDWPKPIYMRDDETFAYHGYAGGLGPDNLAEQLPLIAQAAGDCRIWIDMETRVRSSDDRQFDLAKVERCLEIAAPFITKSGA